MELMIKTWIKIFFKFFWFLPYSKSVVIKWNQKGIFDRNWPCVNFQEWKFFKLVNSHVWFVNTTTPTKTHFLKEVLFYLDKYLHDVKVFVESCLLVKRSDTLECKTVPNIKGIQPERASWIKYLTLDFGMIISKQVKKFRLWPVLHFLSDCRY